MYLQTHLHTAIVDHLKKLVERDAESKKWLGWCQRAIEAQVNGTLLLPPLDVLTLPHCSSRSTTTGECTTVRHQLALATVRSQAIRDQKLEELAGSSTRPT